jgi:chymotrypsin
VKKDVDKMKVFVVFALAFVAVSAKPNQVDFSQLEDRTLMFKEGEKFLFQNALKAEGRIINGAEATPHQFPWLVALFANSWFCSASLINENWVLTAAHCVDGATSWDLYLGSHNVDNNQETGRQVIKAKRGFTHPEWDRPSLRNDLALIELESPANLDQYVGITPLAMTSPEAGTEVRATGWGKTSDSSSSKSPVLKFIDVPVMSESECKGFYGNTITSGHICIDSAKGGVCNGDS